MPLFNVFNVKKAAGHAILLLISTWANAQMYTVDSLMRNGRRANRINLVYLSDGYQSAELPGFINHATTLNNALFNQSPFLQYKNFFNSFAVRVPSSASGAYHAATAADESTQGGGQPISVVNTYFQSAFDYSGIHRLLFPIYNFGVMSVLSANLPDYDQAFVIVNSSYYGGSGGAVATSSINISSSEIAIHELGHSFAGLADEYWAGPLYAVEKPNMTQDNNPATVKWKNWNGKNDIGIFAHGAAPPLSSWFKPHQNCKMQFLNRPFCSVCSEAIVTRIHSLAYMIDSIAPSTSFILTGTDSIKFEIKLIPMQPLPKITWRVNGLAFPAPLNATMITVPYSSFNIPNQINYSVIAEVTDTTSFATAAFIEQNYWSVANAALPVRINNFSGKVSNHTALLDWSIENMEDVLLFEVEKSLDGIRFSKLAAVQPHLRERKYGFTDQNMPGGLAFYRLKIVEKSNAVNYSDVIQLQNAFDKFFYKVYQNASSRAYHLRCGFMDEHNDLSIKIIDANGSLILNKDLGSVSRQFDYDIDLKGKPAGIYFLNIIINRQSYSVQLVAE